MSQTALVIDDAGRMERTAAPCVILNPNPPMGGVKAGRIGMREPTREKAWLHWDRCDTAEGFQ